MISYPASFKERRRCVSFFHGLRWIFIWLMFFIEQVSASAITTFVSFKKNEVDEDSGIRIVLNTGDVTIPNNAVFEIQLNPLFSIANGATVDTTLLSGTLDGTFLIDVMGNTFRIERLENGQPFNTARDIIFELSMVKNPIFSGDFGIGSIKISNPLNPVIAQTTFPTITIIPGNILNPSVSFPSTLLSGRAASFSISFATSHAIPNDGIILIYLPSVYGPPTGLELSSYTGDSDLTLEAPSTNNVIRIKRNAGGPSPSTNSFTFNFAKLRNPPLEGPIGRYIRIETVDHDEQLIDQGFVDVSDVLLEKASVVISPRQLDIKEGSTDVFEYKLHLNAPPVQGVIKIAISTTSNRLTFIPNAVYFSSSNWSTNAIVTVQATEDYVVNIDADNTNLIQHAIDTPGETTFAPVDSVNVRIYENDIPLIKVSRHHAAIVESVKNSSYTIVLGSRPLAPVSIEMTAQDPFLVVSPVQLVFDPTEWNIPQQVLIYGKTPVGADVAVTALGAMTSISHRSTSLDVSYNVKDDIFVPMKDILVYYEPLHMETCVKPCRPGMYSTSYNSIDTCLACPAGYYCSGGCSSPTPCSKGSYSSTGSAEDLSTCVPCLQGFYAPLEGSTTCFGCPAGAICPDSTKSFQECPSGYFSQPNQIVCQKCPAGKYNDENMKASCKDCPLAHYCPEATQIPIPCEAGTYAIDGGSQPCGACPQGYNCADGLQTPQVCPQGTYSALGQSDCSGCPAGFFCPPGEAGPKTCPTGYFSVENSTECTICPAGSSCATAAAPPTPCNPGTHSVAGALSCAPCPAGYSCLDPSVAPISCNSGSYSTQGEQACWVCPPGKYCLDTFSNPISCPIGTYSLGGATSCTTCTIGFSCEAPDRAPVPCAVGTYWDSATTLCKPCEAGYYCPSPSTNRVACAQGTFSLGSATACTPCPFGSICVRGAAPTPCKNGETNNDIFTLCIACPKGFECSPLKGMQTVCPGGTYSLAGESACKTCPKGYKCASVTDAPVACPAGTYAPAGSINCLNCPAGFSCFDPTLDPVICAPNYYSLGGTVKTCTACPIGKDCTSQNTAPPACPDGYYSTTTASSCIKCPAGFSCATTTATPVSCLPGYYSREGQKSCTACEAGNYCPKAGLDVPLPCATGTYSIGTASACTSCSAGKYCTSTNQALEIPCETGTYSTGGQNSCTLCPAGWKCPSMDGSLNAKCSPGTYSTGSSTTCTACPAGYSCPDTNQASQIPCESGYFSQGSAASCTKCTRGYACPDPAGGDKQLTCTLGTYSVDGATTCTLCPAGYQCLTTSSSDITLCDPGYYSPSSVSSCIRCPRGSFCAAPEDLPKNCTVGYYSDDGATACKPCEPGYECPRADQKPQPCPIGFYSEGVSANCKACRPGYTCRLASTNPSPIGEECPMGGYCNPAGTFFLCPSGSFGNVTAGESVDHACQPCPEGYYCEMGSTPLTKKICPSGYYCPEGTEIYTDNPCPPGTYNSLEGQVSISSCKICPAGTYCTAGSSFPSNCPSGYYCLASARAPNQYPCPAGTYSGEATGLFSADECKECEIGSYCLPASVTPEKCPAGTYNPSPGAAGKHQCLLCPAGYACPRVGQIDYTDLCAKGHYCPKGTVQATANPCPAGTYTEKEDLIRVEDCTICPERKACLIGTDGTSKTMLDCAPGFYCPLGTPFSQKYPCPPGTWSTSTSLSDASECEMCPVGKYCVGGKTFIDGDCAPGHYCPLGTPSKTKFPCLAGTYSSKTNLFEATQCDECPPGFYCPERSVAPIGCKAGTYTSVNKTKYAGPGLPGQDCVLCTAGKYCPDAATEPIPCGKGKYSAAGSKDCKICDAGYFCNSETTGELDMSSPLISWTQPGSLYGPCYNGTFCPRGTNHEPTLALDGCPPGYYCPTGTPAPVVCPAGTYSNFSGQDALDDCIPTPAGYYSLEGSLAPSGLCDPGYYCPIRSTSKTQVPCPARYYLDRSGGRTEDDCGVCLSGSYCPKGTAYPISCPPGHYCRVGLAEPEPCPIGTYANTTGLKAVEDCLLCPPGMYCDSTALTVPRGPCDPGYYCILSAYTSAPMNYEFTLFGVTNRHTGGLCPQGAYCPLGSSYPILCPPGTYSNMTGLEMESECVPCPPGKYCETPGLFLPTGECHAGYYCIGGAMTPTQKETPAGHYTLLGAYNPIPCPPGQFSLYAKSSKCVDCPAGFFCSKAGTVEPAMCSSGGFCPDAIALPIKCPPGTFSNLTGLVSVDECEPCPAGYYCDSYGLTEPSGNCFEGFVCEGNSAIPNPSIGVGFICPAGHYCPEGSGGVIQCPSGTFRGNKGGTSVNSCYNCPAGMYCGGTGLTEPSGLCDAGYYCGGGAFNAAPIDHITGDICPPGFYCGKGTLTPNRCPAGFYTSESGQSQCKVCPEGFYCDGVTTHTYLDCPKGYYCTLGTQAIPLACPVGTFNNVTRLTRVDDCLICPPGYYCDKEGLDNPTGVCEAGMFCPPGSQNTYGKTPKEEMNICPVGHFCPTGTYLPIDCPIGTYSNLTRLKSSSECEYCDGGYYCSQQGILEPSGTCDAGYYCKKNSTTPRPTQGITTVDGVAYGGAICPMGHYCPPGSELPKLCIEGSYSPDQGLINCLQCPAGYFCPIGSSAFLSNLCPKGYYCPAGTKQAYQFPCPPGTYGNSSGLQDISQCTSAPGGMYVEVYGATKPSGQCASGFFCTGGSVSQTPEAGSTGGPCTPGTNCPVGSAYPIVCDAGSYCSSTNTDKALPCKEGFYCIQGSYTSTPTGQNNSLGSIGDVCPTGHYCPTGTSNPIPCPPGKYSGNTQNARESECLPCPASFICADSGITAPFEECPGGFYCPGGDKEATKRCPIGHFCPKGSSKPLLCPSGTFNDLEQQDDCFICPERFYCAGERTTSPDKCPLGFFCPAGTSFPHSYKCPPGTFGNTTGLANATECRECPLGEYCNGNMPTDSPTGLCGPGHYCVIGATTSTPKDNMTGGFCDGGHVCLGGASVPNPSDGVTGYICEPGHYCPSGTNIQLKCPQGTYNPDFQQETCRICPAGSYCDIYTKEPAVCPLRFYCPEGTKAPIVCPSGTYGHQTGLKNAEECAPCKTGMYCNDGTLTGSCTAGYFCKVSNGKPNPNSDLKDETSGGGPCPTGHYCPDGVLDPIPCPKSTARLTTHGINITDCEPCPAGLSCDDGARTIACPKGHYCPYAKSAIPCPKGTYNLQEGRDKLEDCLPCQAGKLCDRTGVIDPSKYDCPAGKYCLRGEPQAFDCPAGTFRRYSNGQNVTGCVQCPAGHVCRIGSIEPSVCPSKTFCPSGSGEPVLCPGGFYCRFNSSSPIECPEGYFCPVGVDLPILCERGSYCPEKTTLPRPCPLGFIGRQTSLGGSYVGLTDSCEPCSAGTFGVDPNRTICETCPPGYVCGEATRSKTPQTKEKDNGYKCPKGHYCPKGSTTEIPCPIGTFNPDFLASNASACRPCAQNTYQNKEGQESCLPCSKSAYSSEGSNRCTCKGSHRAFQMTDGYCICEPGYEFYDTDLILRSDEDGEVDCQPIVYDRCSAGQVRSDGGKCVDATTISCESTCNNGTGTFVPSIGLCQCDAQPDVDTVCNQKCRDSAPQLQINSTTGEMQVYDPSTGALEPLSDDSTSTIFSKISCKSTDVEGAGCQLHPLSIRNEGFGGMYDVPSSLSSTSSQKRRYRRRLEEKTLQSTEIMNPMVCLTVGDGVFFDLAPQSYPIYLKDSMLNTNPNFDYGAFRALALKVKSNSSSITGFAFSFTESGTYVFGNSLNSDTKTVITVMKEGTKCPTEAAIVPMNEKNLISVSTKRTQDIILAPDWGLIFGLLGGLFGMVALVVVGLYYFRTKSWMHEGKHDNSMLNVTGYRAKNRATDLSTIHSKGSVLKKATTHSVEGDPSANIGSEQKNLLLLDDEKDTKSSSPNNKEYRPDLGRWDESDLDIRELVDRLQHHHETVSKCFHDQKGDVQKVLQHLQSEAAELKRLLVTAISSSTSSTSSSSSPSIVQKENETRDVSNTSQNLMKEGFLIENLERDIAERRLFEKKKTATIQEVKFILDELDQEWGSKTADTLASAIVQELSSVGPDSNTDSLTKWEKLRTLLYDLNSLLCTDPMVRTKASLMSLYDAEKIRRDIGQVVVEASQRNFSTLKGTNEHEKNIIELLSLQEQVTKAQNKQDDVFFNSRIQSLKKLGVVIPRVLDALDHFENDFQKEWSKLLQEQNPSKERQLKQHFENNLTRLLIELAKAGTTVHTKMSKEGKKEHDLLQKAVEKENLLQKAIEKAKGIYLKTKFQLEEKQRQENVEAKANDQLLSEQMLLQLKEMMVSVAQLHHQVENHPSSSSLSTTMTAAAAAAAFVPRQEEELQELARIQLIQQQQEEKERQANQNQMRQEYEEMLTEKFPHLSTEERERLLDELEADLDQLETSLSIEKRKNEEILKNRLAMRTLLREKNQLYKSPEEETKSQNSKGEEGGRVEGGEENKLMMATQVAQLEEQFLDKELEIEAELEMEYEHELEKLEEKFITQQEDKEGMYAPIEEEEVEEEEMLGVNSTEKERQLKEKIDKISEKHRLEVEKLEQTFTLERKKQEHLLQERLQKRKLAREGEKNSTTIEELTEEEEKTLKEELFLKEQAQWQDLLIQQKNELDKVLVGGPRADATTLDSVNTLSVKKVAILRTQQMQALIETFSSKLVDTSALQQEVHLTQSVLQEMSTVQKEYEQASGMLEQELKQEENLRKQLLNERIQRKHQHIMSTSNTSKQKELIEALDKEQQKELKALEKEIQQKSDLLTQESTREQAILQQQVEDNTKSNAQQVSVLVKKCQLEHEQALKELETSLQNDRQRKMDALKERLEAKKSGKDKLDLKEQDELTSRLDEELQNKKAQLEQNYQQQVDTLKSQQMSIQEEKTSQAKDLKEELEKQLNKLKEEHRHDLTKLHSTLTAEQKRQKFKLQEKLDLKKRQKKEKMLNEEELLKMDDVDAEEELLKLEDQFNQQATRAIEEEIAKQQVQQKELIEKIQLTQKDISICMATNSFIEKICQQEIDRVHQEFTNNLNKDDENNLRQIQKNKLQQRLDNNNSKKKLSTLVHSQSKSKLKMAASMLSLQRQVSMNKLNEMAIQQVIEEQQDAFIKSISNDSSVYNNQINIQEPNQAKLNAEEELAKKKLELTSLLEEKTKQQAQETEKMLTQVQKQHEEESQKLQLTLERERKQQEVALKERLAKKRHMNLNTCQTKEKQEKETQGQGHQQHQQHQQEDQEEMFKLNALLKEHEEKEKQKLLLKQQQELEEITRQVQEETFKRQQQALVLQEQAEKELTRLKEQHASEMDSFNKNLQMEQNVQKQKLSAKMAAKKIQKQKELTELQQSEELKRQQQLFIEKQLQEEQKQMEFELQKQLEDKIEQERQRQLLIEQQVAAKIQHANIERLALEASKKALEQANLTEIARLKEEFTRQQHALVKSNEQELLTQKQKLQERMEKRKQTKLMELEQKKKVETLKLAKAQNISPPPSSLSTIEMDNTSTSMTSMTSTSNDEQVCSSLSSNLTDLDLDKEEKQKQQEEMITKAEQLLLQTKMKEEMSRIQQEFNGQLQQFHQVLQQESALKKTELQKRIEEKKRKKQLELLQSNTSNTSNNNNNNSSNSSSKQQGRHHGSMTTFVVVQSQQEDTLNKIEEEEQARDAMELEKEIEMIQQLYTTQVIPYKLQLLDAIEMIQGKRHQKENSLLFARQYKEKTQQIRDALKHLMQEKATEKALMTSSSSSSSNSINLEDQMKQIDLKYEPKMKQIETKIIDEMEQKQLKENNLLKEKQLSQMNHLLQHFQQQNQQALVFVQLQQKMSMNTTPLSSQVSATIVEDPVKEKLMELKARLQLEKNERMDNLLTQKQKELSQLDMSLQQQIQALEEQYKELIQNEIQAIHQTFELTKKRLLAVDSTNHVSVNKSLKNLEKEKMQQQKQLGELLTGRKNKKQKRLERLTEKKKNLIEEETRRKMEVIEAKAIQMLKEEKELLKRKHDMAAASTTTPSTTTENSHYKSLLRDSSQTKLNNTYLDSGKIVQVLSDENNDQKNNNKEEEADMVISSQLDLSQYQKSFDALQERLGKIEQLLWTQTTSNTRPEKKETVERKPLSPPSLEAVEQYQRLVCQAITKAWKDPVTRNQQDEDSSSERHQQQQQEDDDEITEERPDAKLEIIPVEKLMTRTRIRLDFASSLTGMSNKNSTTKKAEKFQVAVAKTLPFSGLSMDQKQQNAFWSAVWMDPKTNTLYIKQKHMENAGQVAIIVLHALAHQRVHKEFSEWKDTDPAFITELYTLLSTCYQGFFASFTKETRIDSAKTEEELDQELALAIDFDSERKKKSRKKSKIQERLQEMENFLSSLDDDLLVSSGEVDEEEEHLSQGIQKAKSARSLLATRTSQRNLLQAQLDTAEKLHTEVLKQYQEEQKTVDTT